MLLQTNPLLVEKCLKPHQNGDKSNDQKPGLCSGLEMQKPWSDLSSSLWGKKLLWGMKRGEGADCRCCGQYFHIHMSHFS